mmetsp:Transcript_9137/g.26106  ORF Transcript_9137/g.26106 Transcript_9137/m.26106 type:complete len:124 (+) Transcript_9137:116-487(+)
MSAEEVAKAFVGHFYQSFDSNVDALAGLFNPTSMMTFEGQQFQGPENIIGKLKGVGKVVHAVKSMDVQPGNTPSSLMIFVTGTVQIGEGNANPLHFCEFFCLVSTGPGQYYVHNDIFRLNYGL